MAFNEHFPCLLFMNRAYLEKKKTEPKTEAKNVAEERESQEDEARLTNFNCLPMFGHVRFHSVGRCL